MELEIANYLNQVSEGRLSSESKLQIRAMLREVTEIESIGDSCYNLARTINRKRQTNQDFTEKQYEHIHFMMKLTNDALEQMIVVVEKPEHHSIDVNKSFNIENEINNYRNQLKNQNILDVNNKEYDYQMGVYYMDIIAECEKLGDYVVNEMGEVLCSIIAQLLLNSPISHLPFNYPSYGSKSSFPTPQSGHTQSSGMSSKAVPGSIPLSGSPNSGS